jgi:hypothetical protein
MQLRKYFPLEFGPHTALPLKEAFGDSFIQGVVKKLDTEK